MSSNDDDGQLGLVLAIVSGLLAGVVCLVTGLAIRQAGIAATMSVATQVVRRVAVPATATPDAAGAAQAASDAAGVKVEYGVVSFYFSSGKAELAGGAEDALRELVKGARAGRKLVVSGFHDAGGGAARNAALAGLRATAVRDALKEAGVPAEQIEVRQPEAVEGGHGAEARRVEVAVQ